MSEKDIAASSLRDRKNLLDSKINTIYASVSNTHDIIDTYFFPENVISFRVFSYSIPYRWNNIDSSWGQLIEFTETPGIATLALPILTQGHYTVSEYLTELETQMNSASPNSRTYTATANPNTDLITITVSSGNFTLFFQGTSYIAYQLGFNFTTTGVASTGGSLTAPFPHQIEDPVTPYIYIGSDFLQVETPISSTSGIAAYDNASDLIINLAEVPINKPWGETLTPIKGFLGQLFPIGDPNQNITLVNRGISVHIEHPQRLVTPIGGTEEQLLGSINTDDYWSVTFEMHIA